MQELETYQSTQPTPRWVQLIGWFVTAEILLNGVIVATVSVVGWDGIVRRNRVVIQLVVLAIALLFAVIQAMTRAISRALSPRLHPFADSATRDTQLLANMDRLEHLLVATQADAARAAAIQRELEQARLTAASETTAMQRLTATLQTVIAAEQVERQAARLWRCHRAARGELVCTLPIGRTHGIVDGVQFTVIDTEAARPVGQFRVTGIADSFAACTMLDGEGWLKIAERYANAELPPHTLQFSLPDAAQDIDAASADQMLRLLGALATPVAAPLPRPIAAPSWEVLR